MTDLLSKQQEKIYLEIEMLDREWSNRLPNFMVKGTLPNADGALTSTMLIFVIATSGILMLGAAVALGPIAFLAGLPFLFFSFWSLRNHNNRRNKYLEEKNRYEEERRKLESMLRK